MKQIVNLIFEPKGRHDPTQAYQIKDIVMDATGSRAYFALQDVPAGIALEDARYWIMQIDLSHVEAAEGGYYKPEVDAQGNLSWTASKDDMPMIAGANITGPQGEPGYTPVKGKDYFDGAKGDPGTPVTVSNVSESSVDGGSNVVTFSDGKTLTVKNGKKGNDGAAGAPGADGAKGDKGDKGDTGDAGADGERGTGILKVTTAPTSYTTSTGGKNPIKRMSISTIKTQAGVKEVLVGDLISYSYYLYHIYYLDATYAYMDVSQSIRGAAGAAGADGEDGVAGKSAYAYAQDGGYTGTETEFAAKLAIPVITPEMYGANSSNDDSAAIQSAINAAAGSNAVVLLSGVYGMSSPVTIPEKTKIQLEGSITVNGDTGFIIKGSNVSIEGNGLIYVPADNQNGVAIRFLLDGTDIFYVNIGKIRLVGGYSSSAASPQTATGIEFTGGADYAACCFVEMRCAVIAFYYGIVSKETSGQNAESWVTQIDYDGTIENCVRAIDYGWMGDGSRFRGTIQPKCKKEIAGTYTNDPLVTLPPYAFFDMMVWDVDSMINKYAFKVAKNHCTILSAMNKQYMDIADSAVSSLVLRTVTHNLATTEGGEYSGNISFASREVGVSLKKLDGTEAVIRLQDNGLVVGGATLGYTNQLPLATDTDRTTIYNGKGFKENTRLSSNGAEYAHDGIYTSGFIPAKAGDVVRIFAVEITAAQLLYVITYDSSGNRIGYQQWNGVGSSYISLVRVDDRYNLTVNLDSEGFGSGFDAIRFSAGLIDESTIVTVNEIPSENFEIVKSVNGKTGDVVIDIPDVSNKVDKDKALTMVGVDADGVSHTWTIYGEAVT